MTFLHPILAAVGIACVSIPIIIHILMRRRRKPVMWAAMRFLLEAYRQHKRRLRLEQILLLAARCLLIALIGLALARPLLGHAGILGGRGAVTMYLLIDNGLASSAEPSGEAAGKDSSALARHKTAAIALLEQLDPASGDRAGLIALGGPSKPIVIPPSTSIAGLREAITALTATDSATDIPGGLALVRSAIDSAASPEAGGRTVVALLSDYFAGSADLERKLTDLGGGDGPRKADVVFLSSRPAQSGPANISISGVEPLQPIVIAARSESPSVGVQSPVRVMLHRSGDGVASAAATTVRFAVETQSAPRPAPAGQAVVRWAPGQTEASATASVDFGSAGRAGGSLVLSAAIDADAIAGDNLWRRPVETRQSLRVGLIAPRRTGPIKPGLEQYEPADWFRLALQPVDPTAAHADVEIEIVEIEPSAVDAGRLAGLDAAIVPRPDALAEGTWRRLRTFADAGGLILVSPPAQATVHLWADAMARDLALPWSASREARAYPAGETVSADKAGPRDLLAMLEPELPKLVAPVRVSKVLPFDAGAKDAASVLLKLSDGTPLVLAAAPGIKDAATGANPSPEASQRGLVVLLTTALAFDWTDLQSKPLMVALMQELVRQGVGRARGTYSDLAGTSPELPQRWVELRPFGQAPTAIIKAALGRTADPVRRAGVWRAVDETGASRGLLAVNADPAAGRTNAQPTPAGGIGRPAGDRNAVSLPGASANSPP